MPQITVPSSTLTASGVQAFAGWKDSGSNVELVTATDQVIAGNDLLVLDDLAIGDEIVASGLLTTLAGISNTGNISTTNLSTTDLIVNDDALIVDDLSVGGDITASGELFFPEANKKIGDGYGGTKNPYRIMAENDIAIEDPSSLAEVGMFYGDAGVFGDGACPMLWTYVPNGVSGLGEFVIWDNNFGSTYSRLKLGWDIEEATPSTAHKQNSAILDIGTGNSVGDTWRSIAQFTGAGNLLFPTNGNIGSGWSGGAATSSPAEVYITTGLAVEDEATENEIGFWYGGAGTGDGAMTYMWAWQPTGTQKSVGILNQDGDYTATYSRWKLGWDIKENTPSDAERQNSAILDIGTYNSTGSTWRSTTQFLGDGSLLFPDNGGIGTTTAAGGYGGANKPNTITSQALCMVENAAETKEIGLEIGAGLGASSIGTGIFAWVDNAVQEPTYILNFDNDYTAEYSRWRLGWTLGEDTPSTANKQNSAILDIGTFNDTVWRSLWQFQGAGSLVGSKALAIAEVAPTEAQGGLVLRNTTAAAAGPANQNSPGIFWGGRIWDSSDKDLTWRAFSDFSGNTLARLTFGTSVDGGAYSEVMHLESTGAMYMTRASGSHILWSTDGIGTIGRTTGNRPKAVHVEEYIEFADQVGSMGVNGLTPGFGNITAFRSTSTSTPMSIFTHNADGAGNQNIVITSYVNSATRNDTFEILNVGYGDVGGDNHHTQWVFQGGGALVQSKAIALPETAPTEADGGIVLRNTTLADVTNDQMSPGLFFHSASWRTGGAASDEVGWRMYNKGIQGVGHETTLCFDSECGVTEAWTKKVELQGYSAGVTMRLYGGAHVKWDTDGGGDLGVSNANRPRAAYFTDKIQCETNAIRISKDDHLVGFDDGPSVRFVDSTKTAQLMHDRADGAGNQNIVITSRLASLTRNNTFEILGIGHSDTGTDAYTGLWSFLGSGTLNQSIAVALPETLPSETSGGIVLENTTAADVTNDQASPGLFFGTRAWQTGGSVGSKDVTMRLATLGRQAGTARSDLYISGSTDGAVYTDLFKFGSAGAMTLIGSNNPILWDTDGGGGIGASGANRPDEIHVKDKIQIDGTNHIIRINAESLGLGDLSSHVIGVAQDGTLLNIQTDTSDAGEGLYIGTRFAGAPTHANYNVVSLGIGNAGTTTWTTLLGVRSGGTTKIAESLIVAGDEGTGEASTVMFTNATAAADITNPTHIKLPTGVAAAQAGWLKIYVGTTVSYIPYWQ